MDLTCPTCGLPVEQCVCRDEHIAQQINSIHVEERKYGKEVTVIEINSISQIVDPENLLEKFRSKFACGGTVENRTSFGSNESNGAKQIELQGNHKSNVEEYLLTNPRFCQNCNAVLSEYGDVDYCPECGVEVTSGGDSENTEVYDE